MSTLAQRDRKHRLATIVRKSHHLWPEALCKVRFCRDGDGDGDLHNIGLLFLLLLFLLNSTNHNPTYTFFARPSSFDCCFRLSPSPSGCQQNVIYGNDLLNGTRTVIYFILFSLFCRLLCLG
jgi:hypothetical protein